MGLRQLSLRAILLLIVGALALLIAILVGREVYTGWERLARIKSLKEATVLSDRLFDTATKLSVERNIAFSMLYVSDAETIQSLSQQLEISRKDTDEAWQPALKDLKQYYFPELSEQSVNSVRQFETLQALRQQIDATVAQPVAKRDLALRQKWMAATTDMIMQTEDLQMQFTKHYADTDSIVTLQMRFKYFLENIMEYSGRERALIGRLIVENADPAPAERAQLLQWQGMVEQGWRESNTLADQGRLYPVIKPYFQDAKSHYFAVYDMMKSMFYVPDSTHGRVYPITIELWLELDEQTVDSLYALKDAALKETRGYMDGLAAKTQKNIFIDMVLLLLALCVCAYSFWVIIYRVSNPINAMIAALVGATEGKTVALLPVYNTGDEIGKLAEVLRIFHENSEKIKQGEQELRRYTYALERSNKELDDFAYIASHDLKEPLRGIHNHSRFLIEDNQGKLDQESMTRLDRLSYLSQRMEQLVNDLLYFSRLGRQEMAIQDTDINAVIHDIESTMDVFIREHRVSINIPKLLPTVTCDKVRVTEVFRNLITNAAKYNDKQEKIVEIGFLDEFRYPDKSMASNVFYVKDNGNGIAEEFYDEIFRIFKRLQSTKDSRTEGTGVGLTFVKKIVERHGGRIWLTSDMGKGTTFYFTLR